jgi:hypothetical protein
VLAHPLCRRLALLSRAGGRTSRWPSAQARPAPAPGRTPPAGDPHPRPGRPRTAGRTPRIETDATPGKGSSRRAGAVRGRPAFVGERGTAFDADGALGGGPGVVRPCLTAFRLLAFLGVSRWADGGAGLLLAGVAQVRVGVLGSPVLRLYRLPAGVGEPRPAAGASGTTDFALGCLLLGRLPRSRLLLLSQARCRCRARAMAASRRGLPIASSRLCGPLRPKRANTSPVGPCSRSWFSPTAMIGIFLS